MRERVVLFKFFLVSQKEGRYVGGMGRWGRGWSGKAKKKKHKHSLELSREIT